MDGPRLTTTGIGIIVLGLFLLVAAVVALSAMIAVAIVGSRAANAQTPTQQHVLDQMAAGHELVRIVTLRQFRGETWWLRPSAESVHQQTARAMMRHGYIVPVGRESNDGWMRQRVYVRVKP